jgi:tRNA (guanine-N7-)-methyltransferase
MGKMRPSRRTEARDLNEQTKPQFYGRRQSRPLRVARQSAMDVVYPQLQIKDPAQALNFPFKPEAVWLEIGFGSGEALSQWHNMHPNIGFIGCEPFVNGMSNLCKLIAQDDNKNLRLWNEMAEPLITALPDASIDRVYLLNSDPWPKKRHHRRRFIQQESLTTLARILKPGGVLTMTTDHEALGDWMLDQALQHAAFTWEDQSKANKYAKPEGWLETRYEGKGRDAGRHQVYLVFKKTI